MIGLGAFCIASWLLQPYHYSRGWHSLVNQQTDVDAQSSARLSHSLPENDDYYLSPTLYYIYLSGVYLIEISLGDGSRSLGSIAFATPWIPSLQPHP